MANQLNLGELHLCDEGLKLYNDYCKTYEDDSKTDDDMLVAWDAYYDHRMNCNDCYYAK